MIKVDEVFLNSCILHKIGNKVKGENLKLSEDEIELDDENRLLLNHYFLKPFHDKTEVFQFHHNIDLKMNEVFSLCDNIFEGNDFIENSQKIANHLFNETRHPAIKTGELFITILEDVKYENTICKAVGIFKSERKDNFFKINETKRSLGISIDLGVNVQKLDKGCIVLNTQYHDGFKVLTFENANADTDYWRNDFLSIKPLDDNYYKTKNFLALCKDYVAETLPQNFEITKAEQIDYLNRSVEYFKTKESFNKAEFEKTVFQEPGIIKDFKKFGSDYNQGNPTFVSDDFDISHQAVKNSAKHFKSILKLDRNFHVYIHGNKELIERGYDEKKKMNYYKLYFSDEQ